MVDVSVELVKFIRGINTLRLVVVTSNCEEELSMGVPIATLELVTKLVNRKSAKSILFFIGLNY